MSIEKRFAKPILISTRVMSTGSTYLAGCENTGKPFLTGRRTLTISIRHNLSRVRERKNWRRELEADKASEEI